MATGLLQVPCLGRPFGIGMFYNASQERLISGKTLWANAVIQSKKQVSSTCEVITQDSLANKFKSLSMNDSQKLGFLAGIIEVSGSAQFLTDRVSSKDQARVTLKYSTTTHIEEVGDSDINSIQQSDTSIEESATHVVTGILYGSDTLFVFDRALQSSENICDISGSLENMVRNISKSGASHEISEEESKKISCTIYGDISLLPKSASYKEFTKIFSELPSSLDGKCFPKIAFLQPLGTETPAKIAPPICSSLTTEVVDIMEWLHDAEIQCKDLKKNDHCSKFVLFNNQLSCFLILLDRFKGELASEVTRSTPKLQETSVTEAELREEMSSVLQHCPFNSQDTIKFVKNKSKELKLLCQYMSNLTKDPSIRFFSSMDDSNLYEITTDFQYDHVIFFALNLSSKESNYLLQLKHHLDSTSYSSSDGQPEWFENQKALKELRHRSKQFLDFFKTNKDRDNLAFVVTDQSKDIEETSGPVMILYTNGEPQPFEPPGKPGIPQLENASENSIDLSWSLPEEGAQYILSYNVFYSISSKGVASKRFLTTTAKETVHVKDLTPDTEYTFSVEAVCDPGVSVSSEEFRARTTPPYRARPADDLVKISDLIQDKCPLIYRLPLKQVSQDPTNKLFRVEVGSSNLSTRKAEKVLMVVGATGAGKSTLINALANYILGVEWEDTFRFKVITEESTKSQAHSQTKYITAYTFHHTILPYSLTIIDTPGFGDTMGIDNDKQIAKQIKSFFSNDQFKGVDCLHGIGFVTQASLARLTPTQRYIFDAVLSIFGKDIVDNIFLMTTFADANDPPVLEAVQAAKIPYKVSFKFNNSAIFSRNDSSDQFNYMFWKMGVHSLLNFFKDFSVSSPQSLMMTKEVLTERERLEALIPGLETQVKVGLSRLDEIQQEERVLQQHEAEINANKDFIYRIKVNKHKKIPLKGVYTTNCLTCSFTCHDNCAYANDSDKAKCCAMSRGYCKVCPGKCHWEKHSNTPYRFEYYDEYEVRTYDDLKKRYDTAQSSKNKTQSMISSNEQILQQLQAQVYSLLDKIRCSIHRLDEIALRPNPLSDIEYIELLIESEKREHKPGWKDRIRQYDRIKRDAQVLKKIPKVTKEKSKSWWQIWK